MTLIPANVDTPALSSAYAIAERFRWSSDALEVYDYWSMKAQDERGALEVAEQRGEQRGEQRVRLETARTMLADGVPIEMVMKYTGLSRQVVADVLKPN